MKKEIQEIKNDSMPKDQVVAILEEIRDNFKIFEEQQQFLVEGQKELKLAVHGLDKRVEKLEIRLDSLEQRIDIIETKIDRLQDEVVEIRFELKQQINRDDFEKLEKRTAKLEKLVLSKLGS